MALRNLILTGGINHDFEDTAAALADVLAEAAITSTVFPDIDAGFDALAERPWDLVTVFALRWRMLDDDKYIPHREQWAYKISQRDRQNLQQHVAAGRGLLGLHTASICFDTWPGWSSLLGAKWAWGTTFHPPPERFTVTPTKQHHPVTASLAEFEVVDEIYHQLAASPSSLPLLKTRSSNDQSVQTLAWANESQGGRVIYNALAHDRASVTTPGHAAFLKHAASWCAGGTR